MLIKLYNLIHEHKYFFRLDNPVTVMVYLLEPSPREE